jgi:hypothetical protein
MGRRARAECWERTNFLNEIAPFMAERLAQLNERVDPRVGPAGTFRDVDRAADASDAGLGLPVLNLVLHRYGQHAPACGIPSQSRNLMTHPVS